VENGLFLDDVPMKKTSMDGLGASQSSQQAMMTVSGWFSNSLSKQQH